MKTNKHKRLLILSLTLALSSHLLIIFLIYHVSLRYSVISTTPAPALPLVEKDVQAEIKKKNAFLASVFNNLNYSAQQSTENAYLLEGVDSQALVHKLYHSLALDSIHLSEEEIRSFGLRSLAALSPQSDPSIPCDQPLLSPIDQNHLNVVQAPFIRHHDNITHSSASELFNITSVFAPNKTQDGYFFKITIANNDNFELPSFHKHFYFLIDISPRASKKMIEASKKAVLKALDQLDQTDTFTLLLFSSDKAYRSCLHMHPSKKNIKYAKKFLKKKTPCAPIPCHYLTDSLEQLLPATVQDNDAHLAILMSEGLFAMSLEEQRLMVRQWTESNLGRLSLYCITGGEKNNIALLDLLSILNKGSLILANQPRDIELKLINLLSILKKPLLKEITPFILTRDNNLHIHLFPSLLALPELYENNPLVLYGTVNRLCDFTLFLQAKTTTGYLDIKKTVSCTEPNNELTDVFDEYLKLQQAYLHYEHFIQEGNPLYLSHVKDLLEPIRLPVAFQ